MALACLAALAGVATALAQAGAFSARITVALGGAALACAAAPGGLVRRRGASAWDAGALLILGILAPTFVHPFEWVLGHRDPGYYVAFGLVVEQTGGLVWTDAFGAAIPSDLWPVFFEQLRATDPLQRFRGVPYLDPALGLAGPIFLPLHAVSLGLGHALAGTAGALRVPAVYAVMGCLGVWAAGRTLVGRGAGLLAAALLALCPAELWFARYPMAEAAAQCWLWGGLAAAARYLDGADRRLGLLAGTCWGLAALTRAELLLAAPLFLAVSVVAARWRGRPAWPLLALQVPLLLQAVVYVTTTGATYLRFVFAHTPPARTAALVAPLALLAMPVALRLRPWLAAHEGPLRRALAAMLALGVAAALLARWPTLVALSWYVAPWMLGLAAAGAIRVAAAGPLPRLWPWLALGLPAVAQLVVEPAVSPDYHWAIRRWLPLALPTLLLLAAQALAVLARQPWPVARDVAPILLAGAAALHAGRASQPLLDHAEYAGAGAQVADLAARLGPRSVVLLWPKPAVYAVALPLRLRHGVEALVLQGGSPPEALWDQVDRWRADGYRVYSAGFPGYASPFASPRYRAVPAFTWELRVPEMERATDHYPARVELTALRLAVAELLAATAP
ncbi:MAG: hypothetical protein HY317_01035 [Acidobacteria bacterium]|nr:hypothetical protein [Acidobacteriota bacterium]